MYLPASFLFTHQQPFFVNKLTSLYPLFPLLSFPLPNNFSSLSTYKMIKLNDKDFLGKPLFIGELTLFEAVQQTYDTAANSAISAQAAAG